MDFGKGGFGLHVGAGLATGAIVGVVSGVSGTMTPWHKPLWQGTLVGGAIGLIIGLSTA